MTRVVTFGEIMLRLSPPGFERFLQTPRFVATFGGGEANVAVSLAHFGLESVYVTALPTHAIGDAAVRALRGEGVRTDAIVRSGSRVGIYYAETGAAQRASAVIYDRARSSIADMQPDAVDWSGVMSGAAWFHVTGITPALGETAADATRRAIAAAKAAGARVSVDLSTTARSSGPKRRRSGSWVRSCATSTSSSRTRRTSSPSSACTCPAPTSRAAS
jgi:2-dehydro-3-deoxygluconokinase